jgi:chromosome segregation ATPase
MTRKQLDFLEGSDAFVTMGSDQTVRNHDHFRLYAVSEEDVRKMIEAFIEILTERPNRIRLEYAAKLRKYQEEMAKAKGLLPGKEALLPSVKAEYDKNKESAHPFSADDTEAVEHAKRTMLEMNRMLDGLEVELAGIREKLNVINDYWSKRGEMSEAALAKLQEMEIEQMIELRGAEARKKATVGTQKREKEFLELFNQWTTLDNEVKRFKSTIDSCEKNLAKLEDALANPTPDMLPPKIYQNNVVIYPVNTD